MRHIVRIVAGVGGLGFAALTVGCSSAAPTENLGSSSQGITSGTILSRADEWVVAQLQYCQSPNGADDSIDPSCSPVCSRQSNASWDPYRSDCSGFVSWAWGLPAPGRTTDEFAPADTTVSFVINGSDLQPGDALNIPGDHIVLFVSWQTVGTEANFYEEPGCSSNPPYAHAFTSAVTLSGSNVTIAYEGKTFTAIRFTGATLGDGGAASVDSGSGASGTSCYSDTLMATVPMNTCVQSSSDSQWYQCDDGNWVDRYTDPAACVSQYPLGSMYDAGADSGVPSSPDAAITTADAAAPGQPGTPGTPDASTTGAPHADAGAGAGNPPETASDAGAANSSAWGKGGSSGCSASPSTSGRGSCGWLFAAAAIAVSARRRRGRPTSACLRP